MQTLGIGFQVNRDRTLSRDIAGRRVVLEISARDAVESAGIFPVDNDLDIVQFGSSALLELHRFRCADRKQSAAFIGLGDGETLRCLLDLDADFLRDIVECITHAPTRVQVHARDHHDHQDRARSEPATQPGNWKRHV